MGFRGTGREREVTLSIQKYMTGPIIARYIRMERQDDNSKSILLVEGKTDIKRFKQYVDETKCILVNCWGRPNVLEAMSLLQQKPPAGIAALVDADFDRMLNRLPRDARVIFSERHDFDLDWITADLLEVYLEQVGDEQKVSAHGGAAAIFQKIIEGLRPISAARYLNATRAIPHKVSGLNAGDYFLAFAVDVDRYLDDLAAPANAGEREKQQLKDAVERTAKGNHDLLQFTNGHDFHCALGSSLRSDLGERKEAQTYGSECEMHFRLVFSTEQFKQTALYKELLCWEDKNKGFLVLRAALRPPPVSSQAA